MTRKKTTTSTDVGANILDELNGVLKKVTAMVGQPAALTAADMKRATKFRKGGEKVVTTIAALTNQFGLTVSSHPTDAMVAKVSKASSLVPLHRQLVAATKQVGDAMFQAESESWQSASVYYSTLRHMATTDGDVAKTLEPVKQFFARPRKESSSSKGQAKATVAAKATAVTAAPAPVADATAPSEEAAAPAVTQTAAPSPAPASPTHS